MGPSLGSDGEDVWPDAGQVKIALLVEVGDEALAGDDSGAS